MWFGNYQCKIFCVVWIWNLYWRHHLFLCIFTFCHICHMSDMFSYNCNLTNIPTFIFYPLSSDCTYSWNVYLILHKISHFSFGSFAINLERKCLILRVQENQLCHFKKHLVALLQVVTIFLKQDLHQPFLFVAVLIIFCCHVRWSRNVWLKLVKRF